MIGEGISWLDSMDLNLGIKIPSFSVKFFLKLSSFFHWRSTFQVFCKGYGDDWEYYTGLEWDEDKDIEVDWYEDYQIWIWMKF